MRTTLSLLKMLGKDNIACEMSGLGGYFWALYFHDASLARPVIVMEESLAHDEAGFRSVLAHELGHHVCHVSTNVLAAHSTACMQQMRRGERLASQWAAEYLIPGNRQFLFAVAKGFAISQIAEQFCVWPFIIAAKAKLLYHLLGDERLLGLTREGENICAHYSERSSSRLSAGEPFGQRKRSGISLDATRSYRRIRSEPEVAAGRDI